MFGACISVRRARSPVAGICIHRANVFMGSSSCWGLRYPVTGICARHHQYKVDRGAVLNEERFGYCSQAFILISTDEENAKN